MRELLGQERDYCCQDIIFMFSGFIFGVDSISDEVAGFSPLWFPRGKFFMYLVIIVMHVILLDNILDHID